MTKQSHFQVFTQIKKKKEYKQNKNLYHQCLQRLHSYSPNMGNIPNVPQLGNK